MRYNIIATTTAILLSLLCSGKANAATADAGAIGNYTDILCMDKTETTVEMTVENLRVANLGSTAHYAYLLLLDDGQGGETMLDTIHTDSVSLNMLFSPDNYPTISLPATFYLKRIASADTQTWLESSGKGTFTVAKNEYTDTIVTHCINDLPVTDTYTYYDGRTETYVFRTDTLERVFYDRTELGCVHEHTIRCTPLDVPQVEIDELDNVCQTADKMQISYSITKGAPTSCRISFNKTAHTAGFTDTIVDLTSESIIELDLPTSQRQDYEIYLQFYDKNSTTGCESDTYKRLFMPNLSGFVQQKWDDVLFVDNNDKNCEPDCDGDLKFSTYQWYKNGKPIEGATSQVYHENNGLNGVYYVMMTDTAGNEYRSCEKEIRPVAANDRKQPLHIAPVPALAGETLTLTGAAEGSIMLTDMTGRVIVNKTALNEGIQQMTAPQEAGIYILTVITEDGKQESIKLTVR